MNPDNNNILILGAGASMGYGFPSGDKLMENILDLCSTRNPVSVNNNELAIPTTDSLHIKLAVLWLLADKDNLVQIIRSNPSYTQRTNTRAEKEPILNDVIEQIKIFQERIIFSGPRSIDDFLRQNQEFSTFGKICITLCLSKHEKEDETYFATPDSKNGKITYTIKREWYQWLWKRIYEQIKYKPNKQKIISEIKRVFKKINFITFNYDRSLEHFFYLRLKHFYKLEDNEITNILDRKIHHVYGHIGKTTYPWQSSEKEYFSLHEELTISTPLFPHLHNVYSTLAKAPIEILYTSKDKVGSKTLLQVIEASKNIRIYSEKTITFPQISKKQNSSIIDYYFLGFGYHETNMNLLKKNYTKFKPINTSTINIFGTSKGLTTKEIINTKKHIKSIFNLETGPNFKLGNIDQTIIDFLDDLS